MTERKTKTGLIYSAIALAVNCMLMTIYWELSTCWLSKSEHASAMCSDSFFYILLVVFFFFWMDFLLRSVLLYFISEAIFRSLAIKLRHQNIWITSIYIGLCVLILATLLSAATLKLTLGFVPYNESNVPVSIFFIFQQGEMDAIILFFIPILTYFIASPFLFRDVRRKVTLESNDTSLAI